MEWKKASESSAWKFRTVFRTTKPNSLEPEKHQPMRDVTYAS
jgi:hypothetical protein